MSTLSERSPILRAIARLRQEGWGRVPAAAVGAHAGFAGLTAAYTLIFHPG